MSFEELVEAFRKCFPELKSDQFKGDGKTWEYAEAAPGRYNNNVHYEICKHGKDVFIEFHVETYANGRNELVRRLQSAFGTEENRRIYLADSYYSSYYWKERLPVFTADQVKADVKSMREVVEQSLFREKTDNRVQQEVGIACEFSLVDLIMSELRIPLYQRDYCWDSSNIDSLLTSISDWMENGIGERAPFHLGTIILKQNAKDQCFEIVDGQQRLTTMSIFYAIVGKGVKAKDVPLLRYEGLRINVKAEKALVAAKQTLEKWRDKFSDEWFKRISLSVVCLKANTAADLAYRFFNHINSTGVRLSDYDLLKSHHLRFVPNARAGSAARRWDKMVYENGNAELKADLLHRTLYRLRKWGAGERFPIDADKVDERLVFKHFSAPAELVESVIPHETPVEFDSLISGGLPFFNFVDDHRRIFETYSRLPAVVALDKTLQWHSGGVLWSGIRALGYLFYCKFGDAYIKEALYCIAFSVSSLRNETYVRQRILGDPNKEIFSLIVSLLDRATGENQFLSKMLERRRMFAITNKPGRTAESYWRALLCYLRALEPNAVSFKEHFSLSEIVEVALDKAIKEAR